ncbi:MAG: ATP-binding cassette domain-containing protein [Anaerolineales bacterium]|jgi:ABC-type sugar transport system ATPase subunit|nr:ATP-binding cassette domain-containing protein [Anaerolineales bacterium]
MDGPQPLLEMEHITKSFGAVHALQDVSFRVYPGEAVGLVGDNGAGKSTLVKIVSGVEHPDSGVIRFDGQVVSIRNPEYARTLGIETLYQDLALINNLDIVANMFLGRELVQRLLLGAIQVLRSREMETESRQILERLKINIGSVREKVEVLSGGQRQAIALGRAVGFGKKLILLDEPTAALGLREAQQALEIIGRLKGEGIATVIISHNLQHVFSVVDRIVVIRRGVIRGERLIGQVVGDEIVSMITGAAELRKLEGGLQPSSA